MKAIKLLCLILLLMFNAAGCERNLAESPESAKKIKSLHQAAASMEQSPKTLHEAAKAGKIADVKSFISKGADVNAKDGAGRTPLHYAIQRSHREIAELLLSEQIRPLSGDLARIALAIKRLQKLTNHATPFEKKLLDIDELLVHLNIKDLIPALEWDKLKGLKIKKVLESLAEQNNEYFTKNPELQSDEAEIRILSFLKNAINEFLEAGRILDESDAAYDDDALFSKVLYVLGKRQETYAQQIFARLIKNLADWQEKTEELETKVAALETRLSKEEGEFSKMGQNNYRILQIDSEELNALGNNVCVEGDINGDGFADILISSCLWKNNTGRVFVFFGGKDIDFSSPDLVFEGENEGDYFGDQSGVFADINNDGYDDIIIGARGCNSFDGLVYIYYSGPNMDNIADLIFEGNQGATGYFGLMVTAQDIDSDGYIDLLVGSQYYDQGRGRVYLFWGSEDMDTTADLIFEGEGYPDGKPYMHHPWLLDKERQDMLQGWFGRRIDASSDVNGDGYKDILIGARNAGGKASDGAAYLFFGNIKEEMDANCDYVFRGEDSSEMGSSLDLFDIDNDGFSDIIVGARSADNNRGAVYIWWGSEDFDGNRPADVVLEGEPSSNMGGDTVVCGDFNNDGYGDILAGAYNYPLFPVCNGRAYVFYGNEKGLMDTDCDYIFDPEEISGFFGMSISLGDVNDDGYIDALIGAPFRDNVFLYFGPFATEDLQDRIKVQQKVVAEVKQQLADTKRELQDARKFLLSSENLQGVFKGLPESMHRFLTPELQELQDETVASLRDDSYVLREAIRENQIGMSDIALSAYIDELTQQIDTLENHNKGTEDQEEELKTLKKQLSWFEKVKYVPGEERETKKNILHKEMTMLRGN